MKYRIIISIIGLSMFLMAIESFSEPPRRRTLPPKLKTQDGSIMVWVPGGQRFIGSDNGPEDARPAHKVKIPTFYIDQYEVTNEQYVNFCRKAGHSYPPHLKRGKIPKGKEKRPVVNVTFLDAEAYARWIRKKVPTEAEWEVAARGREGFVYPWGNKFKRFSAIKLGKTRAVGSKPKDISPYGVFDMAGNVMEWTRDHYIRYPGAKINIPKQPEHRVVKGAYFKTRKSRDCSLYIRKSFDKNTRSPHIGFRCVREIRYK